MTAVPMATAPPRRRDRHVRTNGRTAGPRHLVVAARLAPPPLRSGTVERSRLLGAIRDQPMRTVVALVAPPGYGKTTLLAQWVAAARADEKVTWLRLDDVDDDPASLIADLGAALGPAAWNGSLLAGDRADRSAAGLVRQLQSAGCPMLLILDDIHRLVSRAALDVVERLIDDLPAGIRIGLAGRTPPDLPLARYRAEGRLLDIRSELLALDEAETTALVTGVGCQLAPAEIRTLMARTEGWPVASYLGALTVLDGRDLDGRDHAAGVGRVSGADPYIAGYLRSEFERELSDEDMTLLTRTAVLETVSGPAADAMAAVAGGGDRLHELARDSQLIVSLDPSGREFRYHRVLRGYLLAELERREPGTAPHLHRAAAKWYMASGQPDRAIQHANAGGDWKLAARVVTAAASTSAGDTVDRCLSVFDRTTFERYPPLAVVAAWRHLLAGRPQAADDMADIAERTTYDGEPIDGSASFRSQRARLRAVMARRGPESALEDADLAVSEEGPGSPWRSAALWLLGEAYLLIGERERALVALHDAIEIGSSRDPVAQPVARARLASTRFDEGDWRTADDLIADSRAQILRRGYEANPTAVMVFAVDARIAIVRGDAARARDDLDRADQLWPSTNHTMPWLSIDALLHLVQAYLSLSETRSARAVLRHAEQIERQRPNLGALTSKLAGIRARVADATSTLVGGSALTPAELRVVPFLSTHLSFQEIADRLTISRNTVKTHAMSIYGKLWVSSRDEAVRRAVELGLLEPHPVLAWDSRRSHAADPTVLAWGGPAVPDSAGP